MDLQPLTIALKCICLVEAQSPSLFSLQNSKIIFLNYTKCSITCHQQWIYESYLMMSECEECQGSSLVYQCCLLGFDCLVTLENSM